ncbi:hypothetical protein ABZP36_002334 [Zizania latifolia]
MRAPERACTTRYDVAKAVLTQIDLVVKRKEKWRVYLYTTLNLLECARVQARRLVGKRGAVSRPAGANGGPHAVTRAAGSQPVAAAERATGDEPLEGGGPEPKRLACDATAMRCDAGHHGTRLALEPTKARAAREAAARLRLRVDRAHARSPTRWTWRSRPTRSWRGSGPSPKPVLPAAPGGDGAAAVGTNRVLCQLQSRPCRARKRGRPSVVSPVSLPALAAKRKRSPAYPAAAPLRCAADTDAVVATATRAHVSASVSPASPSAGDPMRFSPTVVVVEEEEEERGVLVERDLLRKLLEPKVISPRAVRPVGSTIHVESVHIDVGRPAAPKTAEEVEAELESDALPAVVSDSSNRVRLVNDAYKRMVGQPECPWLDAVATAASRRISGEVVLVVSEVPPASLPETCKGFSCSVKIEWERDGRWSSIHAPCDISRLQCESRDYAFTWRFRTTGDACVIIRRAGDA